MAEIFAKALVSLQLLMALNMYVLHFFLSNLKKKVFIELHIEAI